jgi:putative DNA primase/helicase
MPDDGSPSLAKAIAAKSAGSKVTRLSRAYPGSQIDMADTFATYAAPWLRFVWAEKQWYRWDGVVWRKDEAGHVHERIADLLGKISVADQGSDSFRRAIASARQLRDVESICQYDPRLVTTPDQWDADTAILCTPGGIVDLTTGEIRAARPEDYCRTITAVAPAERGAPLGPLFHRVLDNVTSGDAAVARYLQKVAGYCLFGVEWEKLMFVIVGETGSGKTTLFETFLAVMGGYAATTSVENFLEDPRHMRTSTNDLAQIGDTTRMVVTGEPDPGSKLSASWIKRLVGEDRVFLRQNYQQGAAKKRPWKIILHCNDIPRLPENEPAVRERLRILPGGKTIPPSERIGDLRARLIEEYPSILRWMVDGAALWWREKLGPPPSRAVETGDEYFAAQDPFIRWLAERVVKDTSAWTATRELYADFTSFIGHAALREEEFGKRLKAESWEEIVNGKARMTRLRAAQCRDNGIRKHGFEGIRLAPPPDENGLEGETKLW